MRIELVLDGKPSLFSPSTYLGSRMRVNRSQFISGPDNDRGWEPCFNAITSLNVLGKSYIPDALCFVLGLTKHALRADAAPSPLFRPRLRARYSPIIITRHVFTSLLPYPQFLCCV
jgi:hypothetical protein